MKYPILVFLLMNLFLFSAKAQTWTSVPLNKSDWQTDQASEAVFEQKAGRPSVRLNGSLTLQNLEMEEGRIRVSVYGAPDRSFAGLFFHRQEAHEEHIYLRQHKSAQVDAVQYTPVYHGESNWQLYHQYQSRATFIPNDWNTLELAFTRDRAQVKLNGSVVLSIDHLKGAVDRGQLGLWSLFPSWYSRVAYSTDPVLFDKEPVSESSMPTGVISTWRLSKARPAGELENLLNNSAELTYQSVRTDADGLLPISRYVKKTQRGAFEQNEEDLVLAEVVLIAEQAGTKRLFFDYSDRCVVLLNGQELFRGNNAFRAKGIQYMGHLAMDTNSVLLPLNPGRNVLQIAVLERANGWGLMARLENTDGVSVELP
jgi:hypothetical protein